MRGMLAGALVASAVGVPVAVLSQTGAAPSSAAPQDSAASVTPAKRAIGQDPVTTAANRRIVLKMRGTRLGEKARVRVRGVAGDARGVAKSVRVKRRGVVKGLPAGAYRVRAKNIKANGRVAKATVEPRRVRLTRTPKATVLARYRTVTTGPLYLALGDSWAAGAGDAQEGGYVNRLFDDLRDQLPGLELRDLSGGGATTQSLVDGQLDPAVALLEKRNGDRRSWNDVEVVTITIGGNDIFGPALGACIGGVNAACQQALAQVFGTVATNLDETLGALRAAAGPDTEIVVTAYDNPIPTCFLGAQGLGPVGATVLEGGSGLQDGLNDVTRAAAGGFDVLVAETFGLLDPADWVGGRDCLHPVGPGHEKVKDAFLAALGR